MYIYLRKGIKLDKQICLMKKPCEVIRAREALHSGSRQRFTGRARACAEPAQVTTPSKFHIGKGIIEPKCSGCKGVK